jgi:hypothetical protein
MRYEQNYPIPKFISDYYPPTIIHFSLFTYYNRMVNPVMKAIFRSVDDLKKMVINQHIIFSALELIAYQWSTVTLP